MSKPLPPGGLPPLRPGESPLPQFAAAARARLDPAALGRTRARVQELGLHFSQDELAVIASLDHPDKLQAFLNDEVYYNYDHPTLDHPEVHLGETAAPPRAVLQTGRAHCFEGGCFAYAVNYLHGFEPCWVLLEASQDSDHNLVLYRDAQTGLLGANAHSGYPRLVGQSARFSSIRALAEYYFPFYISDHTLDPQDVTLVGFSEPIDLVAKFGTSWMASDQPLWDIYYRYVDDTLRLHYLFDDSDASHLYPLIQALRTGWIRAKNCTAAVAIDALPPAARELWHAFWEHYEPEGVRARGVARSAEMRFFALTGTTPLDLEANAEEVQDFLNHGYRVDQILTA